ncbi:MAG TPA: nitroreductase family protein [Candidatus Limnocylindrales bacterium]|nr:nitroreductase family protein [Candidatus Limnocylindrales bacterium]
MDVRSAIGHLRAIRSFADRPLAEDDLTAILEAGRRAGSSKNTQRREFVVVRDRARLEELSRIGAHAGHLAGAAAAIAIVTPDPRAEGASLSLVFDVGLAAENMMLAAWERGVGACPVTVYHQAMSRRILGYPPDRHCSYVLSMGYPADAAGLDRPNRRGGRRRLEDIVHLEHW